MYEEDFSAAGADTGVTKYYAIGGQTVAVRQAPDATGTQAGTLLFLLHDHLGGTVGLLDTAGAVVGTQTYWPYGATRTSTGVLAAQPPATDKQYTGQRIEPGDQTLGLYNYKARFYSTVLGEFLSADTSTQDGWNRYGYVGGNPIARNDPTGHRWCETDRCDPASSKDVNPHCALCDALRALAAAGIYSQAGLVTSQLAHACDINCQGLKALAAASNAYRLDAQFWQGVADSATDPKAYIADMGGNGRSCSLCDDVLAGAASAAVGGVVGGVAAGIDGITLGGADEAATSVGWGPAKPLATDPELQGIANQLYREGASIGEGGTADAIRAGQGHIAKGAERIINLTRWIDSHPNAAADDIHAAYSMLQDLISSMVDHVYPGS